MFNGYMYERAWNCSPAGSLGAQCAGPIWPGARASAACAPLRHVASAAPAGVRCTCAPGPLVLCSCRRPGSPGRGGAVRCQVEVAIAELRRPNTHTDVRAGNATKGMGGRACQVQVRARVCYQPCQVECTCACMVVRLHREFCSAARRRAAPTTARALAHSADHAYE